MNIDAGHLFVAAITTAIGIVIGAVARVFWAGFGAAGVRMANAQLAQANAALLVRIECLEGTQRDQATEIEKLKSVVDGLRNENQWLRDQLTGKVPAAAPLRAVKA